MESKYQLVILGNVGAYKSQIVRTFQSRVNDLGISLDSVIVLDESDFHKYYKANAPTIAIYFGGIVANESTKSIVDILISNSNLILPIVDDLDGYSAKVPEPLTFINGFAMPNEDGIEIVISRVLEGLNLLRISRRLFISYRRTESTGVAIQLFERLERAGFDVFLDTHSVKHGDRVQDELWHRLVDTDVVVLLNTKGFLESDWTAEELAKASAMSIGILQVIWPHHIPERSAELCLPLSLNDSDFESGSSIGYKSRLLDEVADRIVRMVESLRARSLAARQTIIITEFMKVAKTQKVIAFLQPEKYIIVQSTKGEEIIVIPTVGVPHALTYNESHELITSIKQHNPAKILLLFDHLNIREQWLKHLKWLDNHLPVGSLRTLDAETWLKSI